ncbi:glutamate synthase-related protein [Desulfosarcina sp. BuS5]|nr:glutamate synthase-related protein [Desulfosarcina sp. BuS5]
MSRKNKPDKNSFYAVCRDCGSIKDESFDHSPCECGGVSHVDSARCILCGKKRVRDRYTLIAAGGLKGPADFAKVLALGADAVYSAGFIKFELGCVYCRSCESGRCPTGITTQDPALRRRLVVEQRSKEVENLIKVSTNEIARICRLCGISSVAGLAAHHMRSLSQEVSEITQIPMAHKQSHQM